MSNNHGPGPVPNRWLYCPRNADTFIADKFLPFKTPLSARFSSQMPEECQFEPEMVFSFVKMYKAKLGLWIDLTNTGRFYDRKEVESRGCLYRKLQCRGHGETPTPEQTTIFIETIDTFITKAPLELIGVHCTHGFNRTGFLIVSYMVEKMDCSVEAALKAFAEARPPGIYKEDYIKELFRRYEDEEDATPAPELPDWCNEVDQYSSESSSSSTSNRSAESGSRKRKADQMLPSLNTAAAGNDDDVTNDDDEDAVLDVNGSGSIGGSEEDGTSGEKPKKKRRKEFLNLNATFMTGVSGVHLVSDQPRLGEIQHTVQDMCNWKSNGFPGCQPVSMDLENLSMLRTKPYRVSWKADGTRYMMLILKQDEVYFLDRDNSVFQVDGIRFPHRKDLNRHLVNTLLDGEMVIDKVNGLSIPRYLVYDVVKFEGVDLAKYPFHPSRLQCIKIDITDPRYEAMQKQLINKNREPFSVRQKCFWDITQAKSLLSPKFAASLSHEPDGLIFQPSISPYKAGACDEVLKWKPVHMNSVDFKLKITEESGLGILNRKVGYLYVGQFESPFAQIKYAKFMKDLNGKIIECKFENNQWVYMRERTDKSFPNSYNTAISVCNSIKYPVTTEILLDCIDNQRFEKDLEIMPPPPAPARSQR